MLNSAFLVLDHFSRLRWRNLEEEGLFTRLPPKQLKPKHASAPSARTEESIKVKIRKANMLIDRVKEALDGIRFKDKGSTTSCTCTEQEQSTHPDTATTDSDKENDCCFIIQQSKAQLDAQLRALEVGTASINPTSAKMVADPSRPKTRRCDGSEDEHDVEERYRTTPGAKAPAMSTICPDNTSSDEADTLQLLKTKLHVISENATESESEKTPVACIAACNTLTIQTTTSATNTDPPSTMCTRESQWSPCGMPKGTQTFTPAAEKSLQTDQKEKAPLTTSTVVNAVSPSTRFQVKNLVIQSLPPIDVRIPHRRMQSLLHFSIEKNETKLLFKNETCNVAFQLAKSQDLTDDPKPVEPERGKSLVKIMEKGKKTRSSVESAEMGTPSVARKILELENPDADTPTSEDEKVDESRITSSQDSSALPSSSSVIPDLNIALLKMTGTKRSISEVIEDKEESEVCLFTNKMPEKTSRPQTPSGAEVSPDRDKVLRSYHVYDNVNAHDPGMLNNSSLDFVSKVDENVYRTYINPIGFQKPPPCEKSSPNVAKTRMKKCGLPMLSSLRINKRPSGEDPSTIQEAVPKIWSLGFYADKSTQVDLPSTSQSGKLPQGEVQDGENLAAGEERALKVISFTHSTSRSQLTNEEEIRPAQLQAEEDPVYQTISCDGRCNQWAADLRMAITSIREHKEELEVEKEIRKGPIKEIQKETRSIGCSCSLITSKAGVEVSHNTLEVPCLKQQPIMCGRECQQLKLNSQSTPTEQASKESSEKTRRTDEPKGNEEDNKDSPSGRRIEKHGSPKQSGKAADDSQATLVEYRTMDGSQLETISLTVSYSTGDSGEVTSPGTHNTTKTSSTKESHEPTRNSAFLSSQKNELKTKFQLNNQITEEGKVTLRAIKDKLDLEHGEQSEMNIAIEAQHNEETVEQMEFTEEVSNFISGLTQQSSGTLKKVIPIIRTRSRKSLSKTPQEKSKHNRKYDVNYVLGDSSQPKVTDLLARKSSKQNKDPLKVAVNGRSKDETQLPAKFNEGPDTRLKPKIPPIKQAVHGKPEPQIVRRMTKHAGHHRHKHKNNFKLETTSNSETITTERSKSEGEVTSCQCEVSNGELHSCRYDQFHRINPPMFNEPGELMTTIRKKRSYFNNCVTYYLKRTPVPGPPYWSNRNPQQQAINSSISSNTAT